MQIVIDIPEKTINEIKDNAMFSGSISSDIRWDVTSAIVNGIPLPKGHGRLIDEDIGGYPCVSKWKIEGHNTTVGHILSMQPTIIEADKGADNG